MKNLQHLFFLGFFCLLSCNVFSNVDSKVDEQETVNRKVNEKKPVNRKRKNYSTKKIGGAFLASGTCALLGYAFWPKKNAEKENNNPLQSSDSPSANPDANNVDENQAQGAFFSQIEESSRAFYSKIQSIDFGSPDNRIELELGGWTGFMKGFGLSDSCEMSDLKIFLKKFASLILKKYFSGSAEISDDAVLFMSVFLNICSLFSVARNLYSKMANISFEPIWIFLNLQFQDQRIFLHIERTISLGAMSKCFIYNVSKNILQKYFDQAKTMLTSIAQMEIVTY